MDIEKQWDEWLQGYATDGIVEAVNEDEVRNAIIADLSIVSKMTVEEYTLYQKWQEVHHYYPVREVSTLFGVETQLVNQDDVNVINFVKNNIWRPESPDDYQKLEPVLELTEDAEGSSLWNCARTFISTMKNNNNIGRNLFYMAKDNRTGKYLGVICISSDFMDLTPRDQFIGWSREKKTQGRMINHTAIGSTIVPFQPLGYNYMGGKLLALLCLSDEVQNRWKDKYGDVLAGVTTTSLYGKNKAGGLSQYDGLTYWEPMGFTSGSVSYEANKATIKIMLKWLKTNHPRKYFEWYVAKNENGQPYKRDHRNRSFNFIYAQLKVPKEMIRSAHARGIYFAPLYENTNEFLRGDITEKELRKTIDTSYEFLANEWKTKYAKGRIKMLTKRNQTKPETLFYDDLCFLTWEETKAKYLKDVGR